MQKHPVRYYYKCPITNVEMNFTNEGSFGWEVFVRVLWERM
jgi:hypothetical protein